MAGGRGGSGRLAGSAALCSSFVCSACQPALCCCRQLPPECACATLQSFVLEMGLSYLPVYTLGISAGASFAVKIPRAFYHRKHREHAAATAGDAIAQFTAPTMPLSAMQCYLPVISCMQPRLSSKSLASSLVSRRPA